MKNQYSCIGVSSHFVLCTHCILRTVRDPARTVRTLSQTVWIIHNPNGVRPYISLDRPGSCPDRPGTARTVRLILKHNGVLPSYFQTVQVLARTVRTMLRTVRIILHPKGSQGHSYSDRPGSRSDHPGSRSDRPG